MVEACITVLKQECKDLVCRIEFENGKLRDLLEELEEIKNNDEILIERSKSRKRDREIALHKKHIQELKTECKALVKVYATVEKDGIDMNQEDVQNMKESLTRVLSDIARVDDEIYVTENALVSQKIENEILEKDYEKRLKIFRDDADAELERKVKELRYNEDQAKYELEELQETIKKVKHAGREMKYKVSAMREQCKTEEKRNTELLLDIELCDKMKEKLDKEQQKLRKELAERTGEKTE